MKNDNFNAISKADNMAKNFKIIMLVVVSALAAIYVIGGIVVCALVDVSTGITMLLSGIIIGVLGVFGTYFTHQLIVVMLDATIDIKANRIANESKLNDVKQPSSQSAYERCEAFYLLYLERDAYLYLDIENPSSLKTIKSLLDAMKFQSEEEALKFADYKRLNMQEKWKVVKKELIIAVD